LSPEYGPHTTIYNRLFDGRAALRDLDDDVDFMGRIGADGNAAKYP
jgi:hypothetical protein